MLKPLLILFTLVSLSSTALGEQPGTGRPVPIKQQQAVPPQQTFKFDTTPLERAIKAATERADPQAEEKLKIDRQVSEYTKQLANYTASLSSYTFWLVVATMVVGGIGVFQGIQLRRSVTAMEREFVASHPPRVILRTISWEDTGQYPETGSPTPGQIRYVIANVGRSTAKIFSRNVTPVILDVLVGDSRPDFKKLPAWPVYDVTANDVRSVDLESGDLDVLYDIVIRDREDWLKFETGRADVYLIGFIAYTDITGKNRFRTGFARRRNKITGRFEPIDDPDYEYQN